MHLLRLNILHKIVKKLFAEINDSTPLYIDALISFLGTLLQEKSWGSEGKPERQRVWSTHRARDRHKVGQGRQGSF